MHRLRSLVLLLICALPAQAGAWPDWLRLPGLKARTVAVAPQRLQILDFSGGTGRSARHGLIQELSAVPEVRVSDETPSFTVSGHSVGGRVTARLADAQGAPVFERSYAAPGLEENLRQLADDLILAATGKPGLATSRIAFVSDRSGSRQIYLCDPQGRDVQQLTRHPHGAVSPSLAPDGSAVAFTSYRPGFPVVMLLDLGQGWERVITDTPGLNTGAAFAPDGSRLALVMSFLGNPEIFVTDLGTNTAACVSETLGVPAGPSWHPDGRRLVFSDDRGRGPRLHLAEIPESEGEVRLSLWPSGFRFCTDPEFSPDGRQIAFTARVGGESAVVVKEFPTGRARVVQRGGARHPSWSPNGRYLCYSQHGALYIHDLLSRERRLVLAQHGTITEPRWMR